MKTKIFIINLEKSEYRREFISQQFEKLNSQNTEKIEYQIFKAINGKENPGFYLFKKYNDRKRFHRKGNLMNLSQLGCFASHYLLWEKCIELNQGIIVLEDDAIIHNNFYEAYNFTYSLENSFEFFWLSPPAPARRSQKGKEIYNIPNTKNRIVRYFKGWGNTTGYFITPKAARKLLAYCQEWIYEVDISMERYWENKIDYVAFTPFCVEPDLEMESNIPVNKGAKNRTLLIRIKREFYKVKDNIFKKLFDFKSK